MMNDVTADFKTYHFNITDQKEDEEEAKAEQEILTEHELKVMYLIDCFAKIIAILSPIENKKNHVLRKRIDRVENLN